VQKLRKKKTEEETILASYNDALFLCIIQNSPSANVLA
jgi:hypothetical protein